jgi:hypothetical protein
MVLPIIKIMNVIIANVYIVFYFAHYLMKSFSLVNGIIIIITIIIIAYIPIQAHLVLCLFLCDLLVIILICASGLLSLQVNK